MKKILTRQDKELKLNTTKNLIKLIIKSYLSSFKYIFFGFFQPLILSSVFFFVFKLALDRPAEEIVPGYLLLGPITTGLMSFSLVLSDWKNSILLKRIDVMPIGKSTFFYIFISYFFLISILSFFWMLLWMTIFVLIADSSEISMYSNLNWGYLFLAVIQLILISNAIALFCVGITRGQTNTQGVVMLFFFVGAFLSGIMIPSVLLDSNDGLKYISYTMPFKYPEALSYYAWNGGFNSEFPDDSTWIPVVAGFAYFSLFISLTLKTFKWN
ncbi:hypothetical protein [Spiroplasma endosymbiont of Amphibalanus improvisus]|uniref:hypothetical protein n=1 Tax=Spiroplasma endosymbiont of Amphibalanus improvisus TaxID=3066327 RepID=UPI00313D15E0